MIPLERPRLRRRLIASAVLALWIAPAASALAAGAHLALEHHHAEARHRHEAAALELALAAVHGHHHDLGAVPDHEHSAPVTGGTITQPSAPPAAEAPPADPAPRLAGAAAVTLLPARHGPPVPLFTAHCSLLL